jgi:epoxyqueuosine reductase
LLKLDDANFREMFSGSPIKRIGRNRFIRNCLIAAGNSGDPALIPSVVVHLNDSDAVLAEAAAWAIAELQRASSAAMQAA